MSLMSIVFLLPQLILLIVGAVLIARAGRGRASVIGAVGCGLLVLNTLLSGLQVLSFPYLMREFGMSMGTTAAIFSIGFLILGFTGTLLLVWSAATKNPAPAQAGPWQQGPPQQGWPQQAPQQYPPQQPPPGWQQHPPQNPQQHPPQNPQQYPPQNPQQPPPPGQGY